MRVPGTAADPKSAAELAEHVFQLRAVRKIFPQDPLGVIAVQLEVNFLGTDQPDEHTFHNTDRFMRGQGFDLLRLDVRNCSSRALPARYIWPTPAETVSGRPFQGEAYYARDVLANLETVMGKALSTVQRGRETLDRARG